jgi:hypothetical protein
MSPVTDRIWLDANPPAKMGQAERDRQAMTTSDALPAEIEVEDLPDGVRYRLPQRDLGTYRWLGFIPLGFGLLLSVAAVGWIVFVWTALAPPLNNIVSLIVGAMFSFFVLPMFYWGTKIAFFGLLVLGGHGEIVLTSSEVRSQEVVGILRRSRHRLVDQIRQYVVQSRTDDPSPRPLGVIVVECVEGLPLYLAMGYPKSWLKPLADDLARRCGVEATTRTKTLGRPATKSTSVPVAFTVRAQQPAGSAIVLEEGATGVTLRVPSLGFRGISMILLGVGVFWLLTTVSVLSIIGLTGVVRDPVPLLVFLVLLVVFLPIGLLIVAMAFHVARRQTALAVVDDSLMLLQTGPFGGARQEWSAEDVTDIRPGPSNTSVNDVPLPELQIHLHAGQKVGALEGYELADIEWVATVLRRALRLPR